MSEARQTGAFARALMAGALAAGAIAMAAPASAAIDLGPGSTPELSGASAWDSYVSSLLQGMQGGSLTLVQAKRMLASAAGLVVRRIRAEYDQKLARLGEARRSGRLTAAQYAQQAAQLTAEYRAALAAADQGLLQAYNDVQAFAAALKVAPGAGSGGSGARAQGRSAFDSGGGGGGGGGSGYRGG